MKNKTPTLERKFSKRTIAIGIVLLCLIVISVFVYQSYAAWKITTTHNVINATIGEFEKNFAYTGTMQEYTVPKSGYYQIELWGASGYVTTNSTPAEYTKGTIYLNEDEVLYFYVGEVGKLNDAGCQATWNGGGGSVLRLSSTTICGPTGGGATDVRLIKASQTNTEWNESASLRSRIMVAGGVSLGAYEGTPSYGNGLIGTIPVVYSTHNVNSYGQPGKTNVGGSIPSVTSTETGVTNGTAGTFGIGGTGGRNRTAATTGGGSGGGAGYYGASGATGGSNGSLPASGGSSYISGYAGVNSVQETGGSAAQPLHTNNTIHYSGKYFINGYMKSGMNLGNGKAKIKYVSQNEPERINTNLNNVRYIKDCATGNTTGANTKNWVELQAIKNGENVAKGIMGTISSALSGDSNLIYVTDGDIITKNIAGDRGHASTDIAGEQCLLLDLGQTYNLDEIAIWHYYPDVGRKYLNAVLSVSSDNANWTELHSFPGTTGYVEKSGGRRYNAWNTETIE